MKVKDWLLADLETPKNSDRKPEETHPWSRVMCLTGVDYFSTLGYQPGIAFLAAGALSPIATLVLVLVTLFGALPVYNRVAAASPNGQGSIAMLQNLLPGWGGKIFVLALLGFATTDFIITMTLSAADAAAHFIHNPMVPAWMHSQMVVTLVLLTILSAIFLKGFKEAINIAVALVTVYLLLNAVVTIDGMYVVVKHPHLIPEWKQALFHQHGSVLGVLGTALLLFPRLALGLSGFETGVAVMPLIASPDTAGRIRNARRLLAAAAIIMSVFLILTSLVTTLLIPPAAFAESGAANGRALAYLAHQQLGPLFGAVYDVSTILILAFAGASAMAGLLNLIPRYLPRFGMAPEWALASRPLVFVFMGIAFLVTILFHADVDAQGGAYATGVLVLITSGSIAVTMAAKRGAAKIALLLVALIFIYTTLVNIYERPEGLKIALMFIVIMILTSLVSRAARSTELRITGLELDGPAQEILQDAGHRIVRLVAWNPRTATEHLREDADESVRTLHSLAVDEAIVFFEVERGDSSDFTEKLCVQGRHEGSHRIFYARSPVVANAFAAMLIHIEEQTGKQPHVYFHWSDGNPLANAMRYLFLGEGDTAPLTHEVLRRAVRDATRRPIVHVS